MEGCQDEFVKQDLYIIYVLYEPFYPIDYKKYTSRNYIHTVVQQKSLLVKLISWYIIYKVM